MEVNDGLCLLSLDGGGVRGLSTLYILKSIMVSLNHERNVAGLPDVKPCQVFDLIAGTSTGGQNSALREPSADQISLIAIMLGRLEMDVDECITAYLDLTEQIFSERQSRTGLGWKTNLKAQFSSQRLRDEIEKVLSNKGISKDRLLDDGRLRPCKVFVCSCDRANKETVRLKTYNVPGQSGPQSSPTIVQAALATSAAPRYFDSVAIGDVHYLDGGLGANNPVYEVGAEASDIWFPDTGIPDLQANIQCFLSIGTGNPGAQPVRDDKAFKFLQETLVEIATETEKTANNFARDWRKPLLDKKYFRFNVEQGFQDVGLEEYRKKGLLESMTRSYLNQQRIKFDVSDCVRSLKFKQKSFHLPYLSSYVSSHLQPYHPARLERISNQWSVTYGKLCHNIFERISEYDVGRVYNSIHYEKCPESTKWIITNQSYLDWKNGMSGSLWLTGKIGSGKTYLTTTIIQNLRSRGFVGHFFFRSTDKSLLAASDLFRSYILQIIMFLDLSNLDCPSTVTEALTRFFGSSSIPPLFNDIFQGLFLPLHAFLAQNTQYCCYVVDGVDECSAEESQQVLKALQVLTAEHSCHIYVSSRENVAVESILTGSRIIRLSEDLTRDDIRAFIDWKMAEKTKFDGILTTNSNLLQYMKQTLNSRAHLMILWVSLQVEALWDCNNDSDIQNALGNLPKNLPETYARCMRRLRLPLGLETLRWVCATLRPFHIDQLREIIAVDHATGQLRRDRISARTNIIKSCAGLVVLTEDDLIMPTHHSAVQYLTDAQSDASSPPIDIFSTRLELGELCVNHLTGPDYGLQVEKTYAAVPLKLPTSSPLSFTPWRPFAKLRWQSNEASNPKITLHLPGAPRDYFRPGLSPAFEYARSQWAPLTQDMPESSPAHQAFKQFALQPNASYRMHPWKSSGQSVDSHYVGLLGWAIAHRHIPLLKTLLHEANPKPQREIFSLPLLHHSNHTPIELSISSGDPVIFNLLMCHGHNYLRTSLKKQRKLQELFSLAASFGSVDLIEQFENIDKTLVLGSLEGDPSKTSLAIATMEGHESFVRQLVRRLHYTHTKDLLEKTNHTRRVALLEACNRGHCDIIATLLEFAPIVEMLPGDLWRGPLTRAIEIGQDDILEKLLCHCTKVTTSELGEWLVHAVKLGRDASARVLLAAGAQTEAEAMGISLHLACAKGYWRLVKVLLTCGASTKCLHRQETVLHSACVGRSTKVVQALLEKDPTIDLEARNKEGCTPLILAAMHLSSGIVDCLLTLGVNVNVVDARSWTALHGTIFPCHYPQSSIKDSMSIITALIERKIDVNRGTKGGDTALILAVKYGDLETVQFLLSHGAKVNTENNLGKTALFCAIDYGRGDTMIKALAKKGRYPHQESRRVAAKYGTEILDVAKDRAEFHDDKYACRADRCNEVNPDCKAT